MKTKNTAVKSKLKANTEIIPEKMGAEVKVGKGPDPDLHSLSLQAFLESGRGNFGPIDPAALAMPSPSLEKLLKFRKAASEAANPETANVVPTEDMVRKLGANLPKIH